MPPLPYLVLDVFTDRPLAGNALGIFPAAVELDGATMQAIARELNLSETVFVTQQLGPAAFAARIFTPASEMPFAGHPSIGCAWHLFRATAHGQPALELHLPGGIVRAEQDSSFDPPLVAITPPPVTLGAVLDDAELVARLYGLAVGDLALDLAPAQQLSVGLRYLQVPVRDRATLERCRPNVALLEEMNSAGPGGGFNQLACFCLEPYTPDAFAAVRMFAPLHGVYEDPATGSNAACLAAYLRAHGLITEGGAGSSRGGAVLRPAPSAGDAQWIKLDQGYSIHRPSALYIQAFASGDNPVRVGGQCVEVMRGELRL
jgi:trans-2,3-dihydro-3-hydroxyanthranilate isomerase